MFCECPHGAKARRACGSTIEGFGVARSAPGRYVSSAAYGSPGDQVHLHLPMPVRKIRSHPYVLEDSGQVALMRGPLVYCVEAADYPGLDVRDLALPRMPNSVRRNIPTYSVVWCFSMGR